MPSLTRCILRLTKSIGAEGQRVSESTRAGNVRNVPVAKGRVEIWADCD